MLTADTEDPPCRLNCGHCADPLHCHAHGCLLARHDEDDGQPDRTCPDCDGDGGDKWNDYILPCPGCGGTGRAEP